MRAPKPPKGWRLIVRGVVHSKDRIAILGNDGFPVGAWKEPKHALGSAIVKPGGSAWYGLVIRKVARRAKSVRKSIRRGKRGERGSR